MGNNRSRLKSGNVLTRVTRALNLSHRQHYMPPPKNPRGVPRAVMRALQAESLAGDLRSYNERLQELLAEHKAGG